MKLKNSIFVFLFFNCFLWGQKPDSEVWLFDIKKDKSGAFVIQNPVNVSHRPGYDNQPCFSHDGKTLYYSSDANTQNDIYSYSLKSKKALRLTSTPESEFSPRPLPGKPLLSAVVIEKDSSQRIQFFDAATGAYSSKLTTDSIGYYYFLNSDTVIFYKLSEPHTLSWRTLNDSTEHFLAKNPARCFQPINRHTALFGLKDSAQVTYYRYDFLLRRASPIANHKPGSEDILWDEKFGLMIAFGHEILLFNQKTASWDRLFGFSSYGIKKITRFVIDRTGRRIAIVDNPGK